MILLQLHECLIHFLLSLVLSFWHLLQSFLLQLYTFIINFHRSSDLRSCRRRDEGNHLICSCACLTSFVITYWLIQQQINFWQYHGLIFEHGLHSTTQLCLNVFAVLSHVVDLRFGISVHHSCCLCPSLGVILISELDRLLWYVFIRVRINCYLLLCSWIWSLHFSSIPSGSKSDFDFRWFIVVILSQAIAQGTLIALLFLFAAVSFLFGYCLFGTRILGLPHISTIVDLGSWVDLSGNAMPYFTDEFCDNFLLLLVDSILILLTFIILISKISQIIPLLFYIVSIGVVDIFDIDFLFLNILSLSLDDDNMLSLVADIDGQLFDFTILCGKFLIFLLFQLLEWTEPFVEVLDFLLQPCYLLFQMIGILERFVLFQTKFSNCISHIFNTSFWRGYQYLLFKASLVADSLFLLVILYLLYQFFLQRFIEVHHWIEICGREVSIICL